ncbi:MAG: hypothetical protein AMXMBFR13_09110 [Phycisphaerae bacterium]
MLSSIRAGKPVFTRVILVALAGICLAVILIARAQAGSPAAAPAHPAAVAAFRQHVRPVLQAHCFDCHGGSFRKGGLDLSTREGLLIGGDTGPAVVPGEAAESLLYQLITHTKEPVMPRKADKLPDEAITHIAAWIDAGAVYDSPLTAQAPALQPGQSREPKQPSPREHWAFQPVQRPAVPTVKSESWVRNPIDAFVLARLEKEDFTPSPEADPHALIRRLSLDLLGLPPTPAEVDAFVLDHRPDAYERLVERLLASPHYGERWARHWLDLARYADSDGYEKDTVRPHAWRWRDWLIDAINRDLPFDQFTNEQLAGDLLPGATLEQKVATGFHRNTLTNREGGVDQEEYRVKAVADRVNTTGTVWLGLTVNCAECHSHKYDPISQREYYGLFAFFNTSQEVDIPAPLPGAADRYWAAKKAFDAEAAKLQAALAAYEKDTLPARVAAWESQQTEITSQWTVLEPVFVSSSAGATLSRQADGSILATGESTETDTYVIAARCEIPEVTGFQLEVLPDPSLPAKGPGRAAHGNFVLSEFRVSTSSPDAPGSDMAIPLSRAAADFAQKEWEVAGAIDGKRQTGWAVAPQFGRVHTAVFETRPGSHHVGPERTFAFVLEQQYGQQHTIGRFRLSATGARRPVNSSGTPEPIKAILRKAREQRSEPEQRQLLEHYRTLDGEWVRLKKAVDEHAKKAPAVPLAQTLVENADPPRSYIHQRGDFLRKGAEVQPHTPAVLPPLQPRGTAPDRLDLARWLTDSANPLTARVAVNRTWQYLFGQGLVSTPNDFGTRGDPPTHPQLLDWLATEYVRLGWQRKELIRLIVTSATYRQSSHVRPELRDRDPKNTLLARQNRFRLSAEVIRDASLAVSGLLNPEVGGPSIRPPLPADVAALGYANSVRWQESAGKDKYRRGMYVFFQRTVPYPMLITFDAPDGVVTCTRRERSNTPLQSLTLLNDPVFYECAQAMAEHVAEPNLSQPPLQKGGKATPHPFLKGEKAPSPPLLKGGSGGVTDASGLPEQGKLPDLTDRIDLLFHTCLARDPNSRERNRLIQLWHELEALCRSDPAAASRIAGAPQPQTRPAGDAPTESAPWVLVARTIMNLDEFVTRE